jgi:hypothetical protein
MAGEVYFDGFGQSYGVPIVANLDISRCFSCDRLSVWIDHNLVHPKRTTALPAADDMPPSVRQLYEEAASIYEHSPRAATALLRLAVEVLCNVINESSDTIFEGIGKLVKKGLEPRIQKAMDVVRITGNNAVHPGQIDRSDQQSDAETLFRLLNVIVEKLITIPKEM